jgi:hypothetical protein
MRHKFVTIIVLLIFALLIQNTCPHGYAGKSSMVSPCAHCPLKHVHAASPDRRSILVTVSSSLHIPLFVFAASKTVTAFQHGPTAFLDPPLAKSYEDALPEELLRPPEHNPVTLV